MTMRARAIAVAIVAAIALPVVVLYQTVPAGPVSVSLTPISADAVPLPLVGKAGGDGERAARIPAAIGILPKKTFSVRFGTFLKKPSARILIQFVNSDGTPGSACRLRPTGYQDAVPVGCPLKPGERPARVRISARGASGEFAVFGSQAATGVSIGQWADPAGGHSLDSRLRFAEGAIDALRPTPFHVPLLILTLVVAGALGATLIVSVLKPPDDLAGDEPR